MINDVRRFDVGRMRKQLERTGPREQPAELDRTGEADALRMLLTEYGNELYDERLRLLVESGGNWPDLEIAVPMWFSAEVVDGSTFLCEPVVRDLIVKPMCRRRGAVPVGGRGEQA